MTFSLRKLFLVAPVFIAVGIAAACGPYGTPNCPVTSYPSAQTPQAIYYEPVTNAQGQTTYVVRTITATVPSSVAGTSLSIVNGKLHIQGADGSKMTCEKFTILVSGAEPAAVTVVDKLIKITSGKDVKDGDFLQATAQKVSRIGAEGATLVLEGDAKLVYTRQGKKIDVSTDLLSVNLMTGQVISELNAPKPATPIPPSDGDGSSAPPPPVTAPPAFRKPSPYEGSTQPLTSTGTPRCDAPPVTGSPPPAPPGTLSMPR
jgi:hypothetical protein